ncbi:MAG: family 16 glycoside hydrolase [Bacteroidota bacterium]
MLLRFARRLLVCAGILLMIAPTTLAQTPERPRDVWVFRTVLDGRPRMLTAALDSALWVSYDATNGRLYKAWEGGVYFDGSVYTTRHGPQPTSLGSAYALDTADAPAFEIDGQPALDRYLGYRMEEGQVILRYQLAGGGMLEERPEFVRGPGGVPGLERRFTVKGLQAGKRLAIPVKIDATAMLDEDPLPVDGEGGFESMKTRREAREWGEARVTEGRLELANGVTTLTTYFDPRATAMLDQAPTEAELAAASSPKPPKREAVKEAATASEADVQLIVPWTAEAPLIDGEWDDAWALPGPQPIERRIAGQPTQGGADLAASFRAMYDRDALYLYYEVIDDVRQVDSSDGQPYNDDGVEVYLDTGNEKGATYDGNDEQFIFRRGSDDVWTQRAAGYDGVRFATGEVDGGYQIEIEIPWSDIGLEPAPGMAVGFDTQVDDDDDGEFSDTVMSWFADESNNWMTASTFATILLGAWGDDAGQPAREPGAALRVYHVEQPMTELPQLVAGQTPNYSVVIPQVDLSQPDQFGFIDDYFVAELTGFLVAPESGTYGFRLTSNDGSTLRINNLPVIDHDGIHSATAKDGTVRLLEGENAFRMRYFDNSGDQVLKLEWMPPGAEAFEVVPASAFATPAGEVRVTAPGRKRIVTADQPGKPGDTMPVEGVHPSFDLATIRPNDFQPRVGGMDFLPDGRLVICTWDPDGAVYVLDGVQEEDPGEITVKRIAFGLAEPLGLKVVDGEIYVLQKQELTHLVDTNGDDVTDEYRAVAAGWGVTSNFHEFAFGLEHEDDAFFATLATAIDPGGRSTQPQNPDRGRVIRIEHDGSYEFIAQGLRTPNGIGRGHDGRMYIADNQGDWLPSSKIVVVEPGAFYGNRSVDPDGVADLEETPPVVWLPQNEIGNSPSQPAVLDVAPYTGQMVHGEVTHGGVKRVFVEDVEGQFQGAVFRFTQGLEAGINRLAWGPDGALYVGGIGSSGNWGQAGKRRYGLQRLMPNGKTTFEMLAVRALSNGLEIEFTEPLPENQGWRTGDYEIVSWRYEPTEMYGGPKIDERFEAVKSASVSEDRTRVFLEIDGIEANRVVYVRLVGPFVSETGQSLWSTEAWYTMNNVPTDRAGAVLPSPLPEPTQTLTPEEQAQGWQLLFDGQSLHGWRGYNRDDVPESWTIDADGNLTFTPGPDGGDLMYGRTLGNFELSYEWKVAPGGNSGVFYRAAEQAAGAWAGALEMQVLDNTRHNDGRVATTSAGAAYALYGPENDVTRPVGQWNEARIVANGNQIEHWLNGYKIAEFEVGSADWKERVENSKFSGMENFGERPAGYLVFQDHGDPVWYRSIKAKNL